MSEEQIVIGPASIRQQMVLQDYDTDTLLIGGGAGRLDCPSQE